MSHVALIHFHDPILFRLGGIIRSGLLYLGSPWILFIVHNSLVCRMTASPRLEVKEQTLPARRSSGLYDVNSDSTHSFGSGASLRDLFSSTLLHTASDPKRRECS